MSGAGIDFKEFRENEELNERLENLLCDLGLAYLLLLATIPHTIVLKLTEQDQLKLYNKIYGSGLNRKMQAYEGVESEKKVLREAGNSENELSAVQRKLSTISFDIRFKLILT